MNIFFKGVNVILVIENVVLVIGNDKIKIENGVVILKDDGKKNIVYIIKNLKISFLGIDIFYVENVSEEKIFCIYGIENLKVNFVIFKGDDIVIGNVVVMCVGKLVIVYDYRNVVFGVLIYKLIDFVGDVYIVDNNFIVMIIEGNDLIKSVEFVKCIVNIGIVDNLNNVICYDIKIIIVNIMIF